jgi:hypothetical protein
MTYNAVGNLLATGTSIAASGVNTAAVADFSAKFEGQITVKVTYGATVQATGGLKVQIFAGYGTAPTYEINPTVPYQFAVTASATYSKVFFLPTGKYQVSLTNLDTANAITVEVTSATIDSIA